MSKKDNYSVISMPPPIKVAVSVIDGKPEFVETPIPVVPFGTYLDPCPPDGYIVVGKWK